MSNGHGGSRPGAGRKKKLDKFSAEINAAEQQIVDRLPKLVEKLLKVAIGGWDEVEEEWQPSAIVTTGSGEYEMPAFPEKRPDELVLVKRKKRRAAPDRQAIMYAVDRILGKPTQHAEIEVDVDSLNVDEVARAAAAEQLDLWRKQMTAQLSSLNAPLTLPMPATPTE